MVDYLAIAERNTQRLWRLAWALLAPDSMEAAPSMADVSGTVDGCLASARPLATRNAVGLLAASQEPLWANVDGDRLGQAMDNLISNAIKHSPDGGTVTVRAWADGTDAVCEVQDTALRMVFRSCVTVPA